jgi:CubicO group peptidase (beta-lactamase class C family)
MKLRTHLYCLAVALSSAPACAASDSDVRAALEQHFRGDRTGACVAAALIDNGGAKSAYVCADAKTERPFDGHTAFEIGSVSKTMTAALLAEFIARGEIALDDPLAKLLPPGTIVPSFNGSQISIGNIVTHTSGLPSFPWRMASRNDPYARLTEADLLDTLAATPAGTPARLTVGIFELCHHGAVLRPRQAQRHGLREPAARASALSARYGRYLHQQAAAKRACRPGSLLQR